MKQFTLWKLERERISQKRKGVSMPEEFLTKDDKKGKLWLGYEV
jgi:hypothetical protein